jgi:hypothetical protein
MKADALAAPDKFGTDQPYSIADEDDDEVILEQCIDRIVASLPFHYLGSMSSICRFISIFSCISPNPLITWVLMPEQQKEIQEVTTKTTNQFS